jgi:SAM-dependent methyltransferase
MTSEPERNLLTPIIYERLGVGYARHRRPDPRIAAEIIDALGTTQSVVNIGAGSGSYEPTDRNVVAIEPSEVMRQQRHITASPCIIGIAEQLPLDDQSVDVALAILTVHHWTDPAAGLREMMRVARSRVVIVTVDPIALATFWLVRDYLPEALHDVTEKAASPEAIYRALGSGKTRVVPIPHDCCDGFLLAFYGRPEAYLDEEVRSAQSIWGRLSTDRVTEAVGGLEDDLAAGIWDARNGFLRKSREYDGGLRILIIEP